MAKKSRSTASDDQISDPAEITGDTDTTANEAEGSQDTTSVTGGPEVNYGNDNGRFAVKRSNPPTGGGLPAAGVGDQTGADQSAPAPDDDPNRPKTQAELDADKPPLSKDEAINLLKAGHRLREKGGDPAQWFAMTRHAGDLVISFPATDEAVDRELSSGEYILAE